MQESPKTLFLLNEAEMAVAMNSTFIFAKQNIIEKVYKMFGTVAGEGVSQFRDTFPAMETGNAKISKGENYNCLPYVMLDFPRLFAKDDVFAIRCFFWWGNFFSITLHLSGKYKEQYSNALIEGITNHVFDDWFCCNNDDEWQHDFEPANYTIIDCTFAKTFADRRFIKLAKKIPLTEWDNAFKFFTDNFSILVETLSYQAPMR